MRIQCVKFNASCVRHPGCADAQVPQWAALCHLSAAQSRAYALESFTESWCNRVTDHISLKTHYNTLLRARPHTLCSPGTRARAGQTKKGEKGLGNGRTGPISRLACQTADLGPGHTWAGRPRGLIIHSPWCRTTRRLCVRAFDTPRVHGGPGPRMSV